MDDDRHPARGGGHVGRGHRLAFFSGQGRALAGAAADEERTDAFVTRCSTIGPAWARLRLPSSCIGVKVAGTRPVIQKRFMWTVLHPGPTGGFKNVR